MDVVHLLLGAGANIDSSFDNPLCKAAAGGHLGVVSMLLGAGANFKKNGCSAIVEAAMNNHPEVISVLIDAGVDVVDQIDVEHELNDAIRRNQISVVRVLVDNRVGSYGLEREMKNAIKLGRVEIVSYLLANSSPPPTQLSLGRQLGE